MKVSILESTSSKILDQSETTWQELKELLSTHETRYKNKSDVPMFSPCEFKEGVPRSNANALNVHFGVIDCDDITKGDLEEIKNKLALYSYVCYTSWSHTKALELSGKYRVRFVFPFNKPVVREVWNKVWTKLNMFFNGKLDPNCKDAQRGYYMPAALNVSEHWVISNVGLEFDALALLKTPDVELKSNKVTHAELAALSSKLKKRKSEYAQEIAECIEEAANGLPFASKGNRDTKIFQLANVIAREFEDFDPYQVADLFHDSLEAMQDLGSRKSTKENLIKKLERAKEKAKEEREEAAAAVMEDVALRIRLAYGTDSTRDYPYTESELKSFYETNKCTADEFTSRWIIQVANSYYVFFDGNYLPPVGEKALISLVDKHLAPAITAGVDLSRVSQNGNFTKKTVQDLMIDYGTTALSGRACMYSQKSYYDSTNKVLVEASCPLRVTEAKFDPEVDEFLRLLGGTDHSRLLDFISVITDVHRPCAALYLHSPPGYGKNVLVSGLARLWTTNSPTTLGTSFSSFNDSIAKCPLVVADETMPENFRKSGNSGDWREFIQATQRSVRRIYCPSTQLDGSIRLIMTANNKDMLGLKEDLAQNDIDAIVERLCFIDCDNPEVKTFLNSRTWDEVASLKEDDRIAKHALWLKENHVVLGKNRFIVSSLNTPFHRSLAAGYGLTASITHWLVSYLQKPNLVDMSNSAGLIRVKDGQLLVTTKVLSDSWGSYDTHEKPPTPAKITKAIGRICTGAPIKLGELGHNFWPIDTETLISWAETNSYSSREEITKALSRDTHTRENSGFESLLGKKGINA